MSLKKISCVRLIQKYSFNCHSCKEKGCTGKLQVRFNESNPENISSGDIVLTEDHDCIEKKEKWNNEIWENIDTLMNSLGQRFNQMYTFKRFYCEQRYYNYILIDPMKLKNFETSTSDIVDGMKGLSVSFGKSDQMLELKTFVGSIFYVGKGKNDRIFDHIKKTLGALPEATGSESSRGIEDESQADTSTESVDEVSEIGDEDNGEAKKSTENKVLMDKISEIWDRTDGHNHVIALKIFDRISHDEAHAIEYFLIKTIGVENLTNIKLGFEPTDLINESNWKEQDICKFCADLLIQTHQRYEKVVKGEGNSDCNEPLIRIDRAYAVENFRKKAKSLPTSPQK